MRLLNFAKFSFAKRYIGFTITLVSLCFIFSIFLSSKTEIIPVLTSVNYLPLTLGVILISCFFLIRGYVWKKILKNFNFDVDTSESMYLLSVSEMKRYIPGSITAILSRVYAYKKHKIPKSVVLKAYIAESILFGFTTLIMSIPSIIFILQRIRLSLPMYVGIYLSAMIILLVCLSVLFKKKILFKKIFKYLDHFSILLFAWFIFGIGNFLVLTSLTSVYPYIFIPLVSFFIFSWLAGFVVVFAPSGIGVREAVLIFCLSFVLPFNTAVLASVLTRLCIVLGDLLALLLIFVFNKLKLRYSRVNEVSFEHFVILGGFISYIFYFSYTTFGKYLNFYTGRFDLGNMDQTVWNTVHGRFFLLTDPNGVNIISRLSIHADFILGLLSPFYLIWEDPRMLLLIQVVVLAFGGIFVYLFSKKITNNRFFSTTLSVSFFLNPLVQRQNLYDFHAITLATTFFLAAFYFLEKKKMFIFSIFLVLAILTKENVFLISSVFGFYVFIKYKKRPAIFFGIASLIMFYLMVSKIIPWYRGSAHFALSYFQEYGDSPLAILKTVVLSPQKIFFDTVSIENVVYLFRIFITTGFMSLLSPLYLVFAVPDLAINILSKNSNLKSIIFQYNATIIPFIYVATAFSAKRLSQIRNINYRLIGLYIIVFALISTYFYGVLPGAAHPSLEIFSDPNTESSRIFSILKTIPENAKVAATNNLGSQLSHREFIYTIPMGVHDADYLAFLLNDPYAQPSPKEQKVLVSELLSSKKYIPVYYNGDFIVIKKI